MYVASGTNISMDVFFNQISVQSTYSGNYQTFFPEGELYGYDASEHTDFMNEGYYSDIFGNGNLYDKSYWYRIQLDYDTSKVNFYLYDKNKNFISKDKNNYTFNSNKDFGRISIVPYDAIPQIDYMLINDVEVWTGEWIDEEPTIPSEPVFNISLADSLSFSDLIINDVDVNEDGTMIVFVGYNQTSGNNYVGAVDLSSPTSFSNNIKFTELDFEPYSVDISFNWIWVSGYNSVALFTNVLNYILII